MVSHLNVDLSSALVRLANVWMYVRYSGLSAQRICCSSQIVAVFSMMDNGLGRIMVGMIWMFHGSCSLTCSLSPSSWVKTSSYLLIQTTADYALNPSVCAYVWLSLVFLRFWASLKQTKLHLVLWISRERFLFLFRATKLPGSHPQTFEMK